jgi:D-alanine--D-alanine ligase
MRIAVICGGPSAERGISLNSARSVMDHLMPLGWEIVPFYCDTQKNFYRLSRSQLYSNTPSDFDFKLNHTATALTPSEFITECLDVDIVFPAIHGTFGEDGELQEFLEKNDIPFIGSSSTACRKMFDKAKAKNLMAHQGFPTLPHCLIRQEDTPAVRSAIVADFFNKHNVKKAVVKPSSGGSSIGASTVETQEEALEKAEEVFIKKYDYCAMIEPYCEGREFTVLVLQNVKSEVVALIPIEIEREKGDLFKFRHKYLPSRHVEFHCPPRFSLEIIANIQRASENLSHCIESDAIADALKILTPPLRQRLGLPPISGDTDLSPRLMSLSQFCQEAKDEDAFVFIGLHGGDGENGALQGKLDSFGLAYNGSGVEASRLCMDKKETGNIICALDDPLLIAAPKISFKPTDVSNTDFFWLDACQKLQTRDIIIKPQADGCSTGVLRLLSANELSKYVNALIDGISKLPPGTFTYQQPGQDYEVPVHAEEFIFEPFIVTDDIHVTMNELIHKSATGWIELTVGVLEDNGQFYALTPSITLAEGAGKILSLEEKFQGGTGINLTPPPKDIVTIDQIKLIKSKVEKAAKALGIEGYARIDIFFNLKTDQTLIIEANSLPGLTASTVIFQQALAEEPPIYPGEFLSKLVKLGQNRSNK